MSELKEVFHLGRKVGIVYCTLLVAIVSLGLGAYATFVKSTPRTTPQKVSLAALTTRATYESRFILDALSKGDYGTVCGELSADFIVRGGFSSRAQCAATLPQTPLGGLTNISYTISKVSIIDNEAIVIASLKNQQGQTGQLAFTLQEQDNAQGNYQVINIQ